MHVEQVVLKCDNVSDLRHMPNLPTQTILGDVTTTPGCTSHPPQGRWMKMYDPCDQQHVGLVHRPPESVFDQHAAHLPPLVAVGDMVGVSTYNG
jgi:hypothetical protein